jgi:hypothetical protein
LGSYKKRVGEQLTTILFDIGLKSKQMMLATLEAGLGVEEVRKRPFYTTYKSNPTQDYSNSDI